MSQELRLRYLVQLASNVGVVARKDAQQFEEANRRMSSAVQRTERHAGLLDRTLRSLANNTSLQRQVGYLDRLAAGMDRVAAKAAQFKQALASGAQNLPEIGAMGAAGYYGGRAVLSRPLTAYSDLESATTELRVSLLDNKGKVDKAFGAIVREAESLGNKLPGTTADFVGAAVSLKRQGVAPGMIASGALRASSNFSVLANLPPAQSAEIIAKVREAYGLEGSQLPQAADYMQRGMEAFGIAPQGYLDVARYAAPTYNTMGLTGMDNMRKLIAVQGIASSVGLEGTSFGTNFSQMLGRLSQIDSRVARNSPDAKAVREMLSKDGIDLSFYNDKGQFGGVENMLSELTKLRKLNPVQQQNALKLMFGEEAGRPAQILVNKGLEEYRANLAKMDSQADLDSRITMKMESFANKLDALGGTITNVMAKMAAQLGEGTKPVMDGANGFFGGVGDFVSANPVAGSAMLAGGALAGVVGGVRGSSLLMSTIRGMRGGAGAVAAPVAAAVAHNPYRGLGLTMAPAAVKPSMLSRLGSASRWLGPAAAVAGLGLESYDVITDQQLTAMGKARGVSMAVGGAGGAWGGAVGGAALGSMVLPGIGTVAGGLIGGALGYWGGKSLTGAAWGSDPNRDFVRVTDPKGAALGSLSQAGQTTLQLGEGRLQVDVRVQADGSSTVSAAVLSPLPLIRVDAGATNPGSFSALGGR